MQRITALWNDSPLKLVSALFVLSLAAMMAVASGASFTSTSANAGNIVTAGNLSHSNSKAPGAILNVSGLKPGQSDNGTVDLTNTGDTAGVFTLSKSGLTNSDTGNPLGAKLDLVIEDLGDPAAAIPPAPVTKYSLKLGPMGAIALGTWAPGETHRYKFTVTFPDGGTPAGPNSGDNAYKGDNVTVTYNWESVSN
jgi:spore coat-associated protein N